MTRQERLDRKMAEQKRLTEILHRFGNQVVVPTLAAYLECEELDRYVLKISPIEIRSTFNTNCERIFRLLFTLHQIGGRSGDTNYITMWVANRKNLSLYSRIIREHLDGELSPKMVLEEMIKQGCKERVRVKMGEDPEVLEGEELAQHKRLMKMLRQHEREIKEYDSATYW